MTLARPIPEKVRKLVPLLGSSIDGETLGAARAIGRVLERDGLGFTDLADAIQTAPRPVVTHAPRPGAPPATRRYPAATVPEFHAYRWRRAFTPAQEQRHRTMAAFCASRPWLLSVREREFVTSISRLRGNLSIKQHDWLSALTDRLEGEARRA